MTDCIFRIATCQTQGMRKMQEDACGFRSLGDNLQAGTSAQASSDRFILVLADGMGGHLGHSVIPAQAGIQASQKTPSLYVLSIGPHRRAYALT